MVRDSRVKEREKLVKMQKMWALRKPVLDAHISTLREKVQDLRQEVDRIVIERITQFGVNLGSLEAKASNRDIETIFSK